MGLPSVLDRHTRQLDTTRLLNTVHRLMQLHLSHLHSIEELRNRCTCVAGGEGGRNCSAHPSLNWSDSPALQLSCMAVGGGGGSPDRQSELLPLGCVCGRGGGGYDALPSP